MLQYNILPSHVFLKKSHFFAGLFHRAISMAGTALSPWASCPDPLGMAQEQAKLVNCSTANTSTVVACLRNIDPVRLVKTYPSVSRSLHLHYRVPARHRIVLCVSIFPPRTILSKYFFIYIFYAYNEHDLDAFERLFLLNSNSEWDTRYSDGSFNSFLSPYRQIPGIQRNQTMTVSFLILSN
jgi:hypothetical protein